MCGGKTFAISSFPIVPNFQRNMRSSNPLESRQTFSPLQIICKDTNQGRIWKLKAKYHNTHMTNIMSLLYYLAWSSWYPIPNFQRYLRSPYPLAKPFIFSLSLFFYFTFSFLCHHGHHLSGVPALLEPSCQTFSPPQLLNSSMWVQMIFLYEYEKKLKTMKSIFKWDYKCGDKWYFLFTFLSPEFVPSTSPLRIPNSMVFFHGSVKF